MATVRAPRNWEAGCCAPAGRRSHGSLQLQRYQQQPEDLAEQLPRIERIQVWLHHARNVLEIPEMDRLYGELNKLAQLANEPMITDELLGRTQAAGDCGLPESRLENAAAL